jgi:hypothetical protein
MYSIKSHIIIFAYSFCSLAFIMLTLPSNCSGASDLQDVVDVLGARLERLSNLAVNYEETVENTPSEVSRLADMVKKLSTPDTKVVVGTGTQTNSKEFSYLNGLSIYKEDFLNFIPNIELDKALSNDTSLLSNDTSEIRAYLNDHIERLTTIRPSSGTRNRGQIENLSYLPENHVLEAALAMRFTKYERLNIEYLKKMDITSLDDGNVKITDTDKGYSREFVLSPKLGYAPVFFVAYDPEGRVAEQIDMSEFKDIDGLMLPCKIKGINFTYNNEGQQHQTRAVSINVKSYSLDDPNNVPEKYKIQWPENTIVYDARVGITFMVVGGKLVNPNANKIILDAVNNNVVDTMPTTMTHSPQNDTAEKKPQPEINQEKERTELTNGKNVNNILGKTQKWQRPTVVIACISGLIILGSLVYLKHIQKKRLK